MEFDPLYIELLSHTDDNFFSPELSIYHLTHRDKVLLTLRLNSDRRYEKQILRDLTKEGRRLYNELFFEKELPDEILLQIINNVDTVEDIIKMRSTNSRIYALTQNPKQIEELVNKFKKKIYNEEGKLLITNWRQPKTFEDFLEWYGRVTYNTSKCDDYHDIISCLKTAIRNKNVIRCRNLIQKILEDESKLHDVRQAILDIRLTQEEVKYCIDTSNDGKNLFMEFYMFLDYRETNFILTSYRIFTDLFFTMATEVNVDICMFFENDNNLNLITGIDFEAVSRNFREILSWCNENGKISASILGVALYFRDVEYASKIIRNLPRTDENSKRVKTVINLIGKNLFTREQSMKWLLSYWK